MNSMNSMFLKPNSNMQIIVRFVVVACIVGATLRFWWQSSPLEKGLLISWWAVAALSILLDGLGIARSITGVGIMALCGIQICLTAVKGGEFVDFLPSLVVIGLCIWGVGPTLWEKWRKRRKIGT